MSGFPIPEDLNPSSYHWGKDGKESMGAGISDDPDLREIVESIVLSPDRNKRLAAALRNNTRINYLCFDTGYTSQGMLDNISTMMSLERLAFGYLRAADISGLTNLKRLKYLCIDSLSSATTLKPLTQLTELISLTLGISTKITSLKDFSDNSLHSLRALHLGESSERVITVDSLEPLGAVPSLEYVVIGRIRSRDRSLAGFLGLPRLRALQIDKNGRFSREDVEELQSRGVDVTTF